MAFFLSLRLPGTLEYLYIGKRHATVIRPAVRQSNGDGVLVLKSHFLFNYPSLKEAHFYAATIHVKYEKGNVSISPCAGSENRRLTRSESQVTTITRSKPQ